MSIVARKGIVYCEDGEDDDVTTLICKRARICMDKLIDSKRTHPDLQDTCSSTHTRILLRRVFFLNEENTRYFSVGFHPANNYEILAEFGGPRIAPITPTELHALDVNGTSAGVMRGYASLRTRHLQRRSFPSTVQQDPQHCQNISRQEVCQF